MHSLEELASIFFFQGFQCYANPLHFIHLSAFKSVVALKFLTISSSRLLQLPPLHDIAHSLISLSSHKSVHIVQSRNDHYFSGCHTLERLGIQRSALETIPLGLHRIAKAVKSFLFMRNVIRSIVEIEGIAFPKLDILDLGYNKITHLNPERLITPQLRLLELNDNLIISLGDVFQFSWGNTLPDGVYFDIHLHGNPWNCNGSLIWLHDNLFILELSGHVEEIYAKPPLKPCIRSVNRLICHSPYGRHGTTVVPRKRIAVDRRFKSFKNLAGKSRVISIPITCRCNTTHISPSRHVLQTWLCGIRV